ncbi:MAG TPA: 1-acyl-sn-glycerol-3-phosphate acyltransferase [Myxococcales bacterium]
MPAPSIFGFNAERASIVDEVVARVASETSDPLLALNDAAFHEIRRLEAKTGDEHEALSRFRRLARSVGKMGEAQRREELRELARECAWDVAGNFDPRVYQFSSRVVPTLISSLISPRETLRDLGGDRAVRRHVVVQGPAAEIRTLAELGTLLFVPTHLSNFDSIVFGYGLQREGLPPATYGAGKNLFTNPLLSFFMHNLGAYQVDRRLKYGLYKAVLKAYSCVLIERGYHSLFFPGGTRSRSGAVEEKLKLGLAGTGLEAFVRAAQRGESRRVFFVPATINYLLTLEARTLIDDFLAEVGKSRYIIEDDESTQARRVLTLVRKLLLTDGSIVLRFCPPLDPFGNRVAPDGRSLDPRGRAVDPLSYVLKGGEPALDPARDAQYTRELGEAIARSYARNVVILSTHLVAAAAFARLRAAFPREDLFAALRHRDEVRLTRAELVSDLDALREKAKALEDQGRLVLGPGLREKSAAALVDEAVRAWNGYHSYPVLAQEGDGITVADTNLLLYYQDRLAASGLGYKVGATRAAAGGAA